MHIMVIMVSIRFYRAVFFSLNVMLRRRFLR